MHLAESDAERNIVYRLPNRAADRNRAPVQDVPLRMTLLGIECGENKYQRGIAIDHGLI